MRIAFTQALVLASLAIGADRAFAQEDKLDPAKVEFFEKAVRPLLAEKCFMCHGPEKQKAGLRLDARAALLEGGESGPAIVSGQPDQSLLIKAVRHSADLKMPPKGDKLSDEQTSALAAWIKMGAPWPKAVETRPIAKSTFKVTPEDRAFWSFQPVKEPPVPAPQDNGGAKTAIDRFILAKLGEKGLRAVAAADKRTLIRRAYFDLIGLPPAVEDVEAFLADQSPDAFAKVVDKLLGSQHYGERWARHWLDVARYGEDQAHTFEARKYPDGFRYRDWVVKAFNADMPYDRFVTEQIAGDLLDGPGRADRFAAPGFFALGPVYYGKALADELDDRVDTLTRGFLGLTVACARCHDHKFDPIPTIDYYSLAGIFSSTNYKEYVITPDGEIDEKAISLPNDQMKKVKDKDKKAEPRRPAVHSLTEGKVIANAKVNIRGNPMNLGEEAPRRFLTILAKDTPPPFANGSGRLELARAIASPENPLTARVIVNRIWAHHFGRGIVSTPSNFGHLGERPTHPELLDYLASRFMANGWSIKQLHRDIMLSATYQSSSTADAENAKVDPDNHYLWRANRRKLDVEVWRDAMLAVAGNLDAKLGGPPLDLSAAANNRRTLYGAVSRHNLDPLLRLFDFPDPNLTGDRRAVTIVPLQQLFVLNGDFMIQQAKALATRLTADPTESDADRIGRAFQMLYGRPASKREIELGTEFLSTASLGDGALSDPLTPWQRYAQALLGTNEFAFVD
jgi:mono/diheme cytochrome c family protein